MSRWQITAIVQDRGLQRGLRRVLLEGLGKRGMVTLTVLEAENVGQRHDPVNASSCRAVVHVRDPTPRHQRAYEGPPGPAPQVSKPAKKPPRSNELPEDLRSAGARMVFNQTFSLAPVKTSKAEIFIEIMDHAKRLKRGSTTIALSDLSDQRKQALTLSILRPTATTTAQFGIPQEAAVLAKAHPVLANSSYQRRTTASEGRRKITQDRQNLRLDKAGAPVGPPDDPCGGPGATPTTTPRDARGQAPAPAPCAAAAARRRRRPPLTCAGRSAREPGYPAGSRRRGARPHAPGDAQCLPPGAPPPNTVGIPRRPPMRTVAALDSRRRRSEQTSATAGGGGAGVRSSSKQQRNTGSTPAPRRERLHYSSFMNGGKTTEGKQQQCCPRLMRGRRPSSTPRTSPRPSSRPPSTRSTRSRRSRRPSRPRP